MRILGLTICILILGSDGFSQNRRTSQWSYTIPFTHPHVVIPARWRKLNDNHIIELQGSVMGTNFWYHSESRLGIEIGIAPLIYSSYDRQFDSWVDDAIDPSFLYYIGHRRLNFQVSTQLTYYLGSIHNWNFHLSGGYHQHLSKWRIPDLLLSVESVAGNDFVMGENLYPYRKLYKVSAKQMSRSRFMRLGLSIAKNGHKRLTMFKCWFDLHQPYMIRYRAEELHVDTPKVIQSERRVNWFPGIGGGVEVHGFIPKKSSGASKG